MAGKIRREIISQIRHHIKKIGHEDINVTGATLKFSKTDCNVELHLPIPTTLHASDLPSKIDGLSFISKTKGKKTFNSLIYKLPKLNFTTDVIDNVTNAPTSFWRTSDLLENITKQKILIEFSSPNICKPFHMGHLRSTMIGNFLSNLHACLGHDVVRINYLGDWGTQFGLLNVGLELENVTDEDIARNPIQTLYDAYVMANKRSESDPKIAEKARAIFKQLEEGADLPELKRWEKFRAYTVQELEATYSRLGVTFDEYQWESMFGARDIQNVLESLRNCGILQMTDDGRQIAHLEGEKKVTLVKSDNSTLYLTRDIAAALYRYERHHFSRLLYVVDNSQSDHFSSLRQLLSGLGHSWGSEGIHHVKFGRVRGMSTRKGNVIFLRDILDEARERVEFRQQQSNTTREDLDPNTSDILAVTSVLVNDLKQRRQKDYEFNWDQALQMQGDGGQRLQYTHCRLCSLEEHSDLTPAPTCQAEHLMDPAAVALVAEIAKFDQVLEKSYQELEACVLVTYLFSLCNAVNQAFSQLPVKGQDPEVASQRLLLFKTARLVLGLGLQVLGVRPLSRM